MENNEDSQPYKSTFKYCDPERKEEKLIGISTKMHPSYDPIEKKGDLSYDPIEKENNLSYDQIINTNEKKNNEDSQLTILSSSLQTSLEGIKFVESNRQVIQRLKLNHGLFLGESGTIKSRQAIFIEDGEFNISSYNGQPIVYTEVNNSVSLQSSELCINFPIAEVTCENGCLSETFSKCTDSVKILQKQYGYFFARKILIGGKLFIKNLNLATSTQIDVLKFYLLCVYNLAKYSIEIPLHNLFSLNILPKIVTLDREELDTHGKLTKWMNNLYKEGEKTIFTISYDDLIPVYQLREHTTSTSFIDDEMQPGVVNFKEKLSLEDWIGNAAYENLMSWTTNCHLFQGLIINQNCEIENSKKIAIDFIRMPKVNLSNNSYLKIVRPSTKLEVGLISSNIFSIKDLSSAPFIKSSDESYGGYNYILVKCERYKIRLNEDNIKPTKDFEQAMEKALNSMEPLKNLRHIFNEYGHLFPQKIILGGSLKIILPDLSSTSSSNKFDDVNNANEILKSLDDLNISYLLTQKGEIIKKDDLFGWTEDTNDNLEVIEFDEIIPIYKVLKEEQQSKIDSVLGNLNDFRIITTGVTDLKDLNHNFLHYKRINVKPPLKNRNYEVFGSIISTENNTKLEGVYVNFGLYDFNGFHAIIKKLEERSVDITKCYISWMIIGKPSQLSVFSPNNRDCQVDCIKKSITLRPDKSNYYIETSLKLSQGYTIFVNAYHSSSNYEPISIIKLFKWSRNSIHFQISQYNLKKDININLNVCILSTNYKSLSIDYNEEGGYLLIGHILTKENFDGKTN